MRWRWLPRAAVVLVIGPVVAGCSPIVALPPAPSPSLAAAVSAAASVAAPTPLASPTIAALPSPSDSPTASATAVAARLESVELGLSLESPAAWRQVAPALLWARDAGDMPQIEVMGRELPPPLEPEAAMLPSPSQVLSATPATVAWGSGRAVTLEIYGLQPVPGGGRAPVIAVETHVLVLTTRAGARYAYDFAARAQSRDELAAITPVLEQLVASSQPLSAAP